MNIHGNITMENQKKLRRRDERLYNKNDEISIKDICNIIGDVDNYNWLITNIECYPSDEEIVKILDNEYCWIEGRSLLDLLAKEEFQWIWGVFSAFPKEIRLEEVLKYDYPYADGYKGFWENPVALQHPLAVSEIVVWDGSLILVISKRVKLLMLLSKTIHLHRI